MLNRWDLVADVIIVGGGAAGLWAAIEAAESGSEVVLLEKEAELGGSSAICGGALAFAGTELQRARGIEDSNQLLKSDLLQVGGGVNDERLVDTYVENQLETYQRLRDFGISFHDVLALAGMSVPRAHMTEPARVIQVLAEQSRRRGATIIVNAPVNRLIVNENIHPAGVLATVEGREKRFRARQGIVLASGGFSRNRSLLQKFAPNLANSVLLGGAGNTGDGLLMAWAVGAGLEDMAYIRSNFGMHADSLRRTVDDRALFVYHGAILVNQDGLRYVNESLSYKILGDATLQQRGGYGYQIFDSEIARAAETSFRPFSRFYKLEMVDEANSITELAEKIQIDPGVLNSTVSRYNSFVAQQYDSDFGRQHLTHNYGKLVPIQVPPFFAFKSTSVILATYCGLAVTPNCQVRNVFNEGIKGLYAAGEVVGGFHGQAYMSGTGFGKACVFGRVAGRQVAAAPRD